MSGDYRDFYRGRRVLITGGLGFIGSNLARALAELGADVLLVDSLIPDYGGNLFNLAGDEDRVKINIADVRQGTTMNYLVKGREVIFNLAGQVSHIDSMRDPHTDLEINCRSQLTILEACRQHNPATKVVYAGTRQIYGRPDRLPVDETHLVRPTDINGINKAAGEYYHMVYNNVFGVRACSLRLTNVYGPRQLIRHDRQGFIGWFIRLALEGKQIQIYGDGSQVRDFVFVEDVADAFLRAGVSDAVNGDVFNVGGSERVSHRELVTMLIEAAGRGTVKFVEWPDEKKKIDIGSFYSDSSKFQRVAGWQPTIDLRDGLRRTLSYYREHFDRYVEPGVRTGRVVTPRVPFMSFRPGPDADVVRQGIDRVIERGWFILGPELAAFEDEFAAAMGARHAVGVGTGTDALALALRGLGIGPGDEVITAPLSAAYSALGIMMAGARPVFADLDPERLTLDPAATEAAITPRTAAIMPVHIYGQPADMPAFEAIARRHGLAIVEDACQAHGATSAGRPAGTFGAAGAFSFYPTKNLGALGDAGAIITSDAALAGKLKRLRNGGQTDRYHHAEFGVNSRLDELQAAILRARLPFLPAWTERRRALAARYRRALDGAAVVVPPECDPGHVYHLFVVRSAEREALQAHLTEHGVGTLIHYPVPVPRQPALAASAPAECPIADRVCGEVVSLPLHPLLSDADLDAVAAAVHAWRGTTAPARR